MTGAVSETKNATCLGCGCACDDITVAVRGGSIVEARNTCTLGRSWFGDGAIPAAIHSAGRPVSLEHAIEDAATLLLARRRPLVYLAPDVTTETQRAATGIADRLGAMLDTPTSDIADGILATQRRGYVGATLGELRQRADLLVFWGVDPAQRYPRFTTRYVVDPIGLQAPEGRASRTLVAVDVGTHRGPAVVDARVAISASAEVDALGAMRAVIQGHGASAARFADAEQLARRMAQARYSVIVHDLEPNGLPANADRTEALNTLAQALNGPSRCALSPLRGGGNRSGADAVLTWQTGFPMAVDFAPGYPCYRPRDGAGALLARGEVDVALVVGAAGLLSRDVARDLARTKVIVIGPGATTSDLHAAVAVDTGVAGIHESGTAFRMDDVPLKLRAALEGVTPALRAVNVVRALDDRLARR